jgi:hypothetical protein
MNFLRPHDSGLRISCAAGSGGRLGQGALRTGAVLGARGAGQLLLKGMPVIIALFALGGIAAVWLGGSWALDVRGIAGRRAESIRRLHQLGGGSVLMWAQPWYHRTLGAFLALAGLGLLTAAYALWHLR